MGNIYKESRNDFNNNQNTTNKPREGAINQKERKVKFLEIKNVTNEKLLSLKENFSNITVTPENMNFIKNNIHTILNGKEGIYQNIDLEVGDKFIWNQEVSTLLIASSVNYAKFMIRMKPYTSQEKKAIEAIRPQNENMNNPGKILGDWVMKRGAWPGKNNSCGASVGNLLNAFGLKSLLPQSGRDGNKWDSILERSPVNQFFKKIPVSHPDSAPAGSVLVFDEKATLGTGVRKKYGHVEIKGSDGLYYSYYKSINAGGSSKTSEKNPEKYKRLTGFTGYVYVYNGKKLPK